MTTAVPWRLTYHDGSGNGFHFWHDADGGEARFAYKPIMAEMSSSGFYSGGEPRQGVLQNQQAQTLWDEARRLEADTAAHTTARVMGSGAFRLTTPEGTRTFMVKNGPSLRAFNTLLAPFRGD